jgi:lysyl-tRNA synthetase, class I
VIHTRSALIEPAIVARPLEHGGNFVEQLAPIFFVQRYDDDAALARYFEDPRYEKHAMYVTVFGDSAYVRGLVGRPFGGRLLHDASTVLFDTDLHAPGVERGTKPYGGYGLGASSLSLGGVLTARPTLPQRDFHEQLVAPGL